MQDEPWLVQAKKLPYGGKAKIICCGTDPSMIINHTHRGYTGYCFRCSPGEGSKFHPHGQLSIKQIAERRAATQELIQNDVLLPKDFTTDIPDAGKVWLLKGGISNLLQKAYSIGYSPYYQRVVIPVYKDGELDAFIARSLTGEKPKYIAKMRNPSNALFVSDTKLQFRTDEAQALRSKMDFVITEDILSAIRVGRFVPAGAILGTSASDGVLSRIRSCIKGRQVGSSLAWWEPQADDSRIAVWLDPDRAGRTGANKLRKALDLAGVQSTYISSGRDPKLLSDREIARILKEHLQ